MIRQLIEADNADKLGVMLSIQRKLSIDELNEYLQLAETGNRINAKVLLLETKNRLFTPEQQDDHEISTVEKELGFRDKSLADWRKIYIISSVGGRYSINSWKMGSKEMTVPGRINGRQVGLIASEAFADSNCCTIYIEEGVREIGDRAFINCKNLSHVYVPGSVCEIGTGAFDAQIKYSYWTGYSGGNYTAQRGKLVIHAPRGSAAVSYAQRHNIPFEETEEVPPAEPKYDNADYSAPITTAEWKQIYSWSDLEDDTICLTSFKGAEEDIRVPEMIGKKKVTAIGDGAFSPSAARRPLKEQRESIRTVVIPEGVQSIGSCSFSCCTSLSSVKLPQSLTEIGKNAFSNCSSLKEIIIPENVIAIEEGAFSNCRSLEKAVIPDHLQLIGNQAFSACDNLWDVQITDSILQLFGEKEAQKSFMNPNALERFLRGEIKCEAVAAKMTALLRQKKNRIEMIRRLVQKDNVQALEKLMSLQRKLMPGELEETLAEYMFDYETDHYGAPKREDTHALEELAKRYLEITQKKPESALGCYVLGVCHEKGYGEEPDSNKAFAYYKQSAEMGSTKGALSLAKCYLTGSGTIIDADLAMEWFRKAEQEDHSEADKVRNYYSHLYQKFR